MPDGSVARRIQVASFPASASGGNVKLTGIAVTSSGEIVASFSLPSEAGIYVLNQTAFSWTAVAAKLGDDDQVFYLAGVDGDSLVYQGLTRAAFNIATVVKTGVKTGN